LEEDKSLNIYFSTYTLFSPAKRLIFYLIKEMTYDVCL